MKLSKKIFITLRDRIINLEYPPETQLSEEILCKEFQISRTPLREALHELSDMNLIQSIPRYGTIVKPINVHEIRNAYEFKVHLEYLAGYLAAQRVKNKHLNELERVLTEYERAYREGKEGAEMDVNFHEIVYEATGNDVLEQTLKKLTSQCLRFCRLIIPDHLDTSRSIEELNEIYRAIRAKDRELSATLCKKHAQYYFDCIREAAI
jgi:DNA-binding GntR family transcriptional regulator